MDYVYAEVNFEELYEGTRLVGDIDALLAEFGFSRVATHDTGYGFGEAIYAKS